MLGWCDWIDAILGAPSPADVLVHGDFHGHNQVWDLSYGAGLQLLPTGRTARLVDESGVLVATGDTVIDDDVVFGLIDTGRR